MHECLMPELQDTFVIDYRPGLSYEETASIIASYDAIIVRTGINIDESLIEKGVKLKIIARAGAGMDNIHEVAANARGIICLNAPEANKDAVAEQTIGMLLAGKVWRCSLILRTLSYPVQPPIINRPSI